MIMPIMLGRGQEVRRSPTTPRVNRRVRRFALHVSASLLRVARAAGKHKSSGGGKNFGKGQKGGQAKGSKDGKRLWNQWAGAGKGKKQRYD